MLDLRRLRALHAVVTTGSVTAAAELQGYTASAVSQHVAALERETGLVLLERSGRGVRPTSAGRLVAEHARVLLDRMAEAEAAIATLRSGDLGVLRVVSFPTAGAGLVPPALAELRRDLPHLEVVLRVAETDDSLAMLRRGEVDVAIIEEHPPLNTNGRPESLVRTPLLEDPYRVILPRGHRLADRSTISLQELADEAWVETSCSLGCCQDVLDSTFQRAGIVPRRAVEASEYWPAQHFVSAGLGVALIPALALGAVHEGVVVRHLSAQDATARHVAAVTRVAIAEQAPVRAMIDALARAARDHQREMTPAGADSRFPERRRVASGA